MAELFPRPVEHDSTGESIGGIVWRSREWTCVNPLTGSTRVHLRKDLWPREKKLRWGPGPDSPKDLIYRARLTGDGPLVVCEGEPVADALAARAVDALGIVTGAPTCPNAGAMADCTGRAVVLWPDHDDPGRLLMRRVADLLSL